MKIIYINDDGGVSVVHPAPQAVAVLGIEAIAVKDVPTGKPFKIVADEEVPANREGRDAWKVEPFEPDGIGG